MRRLQGLVTLVVVVAGCNEVLGLNPGTAAADETGGSSGSAGAGGTTAGGAGGSPTRGGSSSTTGGDGGSSGEAGTSQGGTGGSRGGRGGAGGSSSGAGGDGGASGEAGAGGHGTCSSLECRAQGKDFCVNGECVDVTSDECDTILGDEWVEEDPEAEPYFFGALARRDSNEGSPLYWNLKLAMSEFSRHGRIRIAGEERRPVLLLCHGPLAEGDLEPLRNGLDQMYGLGVSSVMMLLNSRSELETMVDRTLIDQEKDVFFLDVGGATFYGLLRFTDGGRLWHMLGDTWSLTFPFVALVERLEELVNPGASTGDAAEPTRLVVVSGTDDVYDRDIMELLSDFGYSPLRINGMPFWYQRGQGRVVQGDQQGFYDDVAEFKPHIVLDFSRFTGVQTLVDGAFRTRGVPPPFYILPPERMRVPEPVSQLENDPTLRTRVVGLNFASADDPTLYHAYVQRLHSIAPEISNLDTFQNVYDAVYYLIYSAVAGGGGGSAQDVGFRRLLVGPQRNLGPDGIQSVLARLLSPDATLSLSGPSGDFSFHWPSGGRIAFANAWCIDGNLAYVMDDLRYDHALRDFTGVFSCWGALTEPPGDAQRAAGINSSDYWR